MDADFRHLIDSLTLEDWATRSLVLFEQIVSSGLNAVETDSVLKAVANKLKTPIAAVRKDFQVYLGESPNLDQNAAGEAVQLALEAGLELWHTPEGDGWASVTVGGVLHHLSIRHKDFRTWLSGIYFEKNNKPLYAQALQDALAALEARARFQGPEHPVYLRLALHEGRVYCDLSRPDRQVVEITPSGWRVIHSDECPVRFRRTPHQLPLPLPEHGGNLEDFLKLLPLREDRDRVILLGWLIGTLNPHGGYPVLVLMGSKGAGKSFAAKLLKNLVDPAKAPLRSEPRDETDLMVAASAGHVLALDNLSGVSAKLSDSLCRLSTGAGLSKRALYTDADEHVLEATRPVLITGISLGLLRDDLADRALTLNLERIEDTERKPERELLAEFEHIRAKTLGVLLDAAVTALANLETTSRELPQLPRLADWAIWAEAAAPALGLKRGEIVEATFAVQAGLEQDLLDNDPVARAILELTLTFSEGERREYTTSELLKELETAAGLADSNRKPEGWPKTAAGLGKHLPRLQTALRGAGVAVRGTRDPRTKNLRWSVCLENRGEQPPQPPQPPQTAPSTTENTAVVERWVSAQPPQPPLNPPTSTVVAVVDFWGSQQPPQTETPSSTGSAVDAVDAVVEYPQFLKTSDAPKPQGLFAGLDDRVRVAESEDGDDDDSIYI